MQRPVWLRMRLRLWMRDSAVGWRGRSQRGRDGTDAGAGVGKEAPTPVGRAALRLRKWMYATFGLIEPGHCARDGRGWWGGGGEGGDQRWSDRSEGVVARAW